MHGGAGIVLKLTVKGTSLKEQDKQLRNKISY